MTLLALETSCDETSAAVVRDGKILSSAVSSQIELHAEYGGVVPELAARGRRAAGTTRRRCRDARAGIADRAAHRVQSRTGRRVCIAKALFGNQPSRGAFVFAVDSLNCLSP
jgi:tRNA A37 threonylcarbamoyltransferase TsaD